ncbi:MAG: TIGR02147 family protein [Bdellovibrio sp.]
MRKTIFEYYHYKKFIIDLIENSPYEGRGQRKALAESINCQVAHITHVLSGENHFSMEQAESAARFFSLTKDETQYFLLLVQHNRAGTVELRKFTDELLQELRDKNTLLKSRLKIKDTLSREDQTIYYSSWHYAAIHMALTIPELRTPERIAEKLNISAVRTLKVLEFLIQKGLATKTANQYKTEKPFLHLEKNSPLISKHHTNFRLRALQALDEERKNDLHYSLVFSINRADLPKVRESLVKSLEECASIIRPSREEELACLCIDLFSIT